MRQFSLKSLFLIGLVIFVLLPLLLGAWVMLANASAASQERASRSLAIASKQSQTDIEAHLRQAYKTLDGLLPESKSDIQTSQAVTWVTDPALFAPMAFALTRMSPDLRFVYYSGLSGDVYGVENVAEGFRFGGRSSIDNGARVFSSASVNASSAPSTVFSIGLDTLSASWYKSAMLARARVFSTPAIDDRTKQLVITLSQPVYEATGQVVGVLGADLSLRVLPDLLRNARASIRSVAYLVDENGLLLASTTAESLLTEKDGQLLRRSPQGSGDTLLRSSVEWLTLPANQTGASRPGNGELLARISSAAGDYFVKKQAVAGSMGLNWTLVVAAPVNDFSGDSAMTMSLLAAIAVLMLLGMIAVLVSEQQVSAFLRRLNTAIEQVGNGEVPPVDRVTRVREFKKLSGTLHYSALQISEGDLDALSESVVDLTEKPRRDTASIEGLQALLIERSAELATARDKALGASRSKAAFLAVISHELRTPLNGVVGMCALLGHTVLNTEQRECLQSLCASSGQLQAVVDQILEYSGAESADLKLTIAPLNVSQLIEQACEASVIAARAKGMELVVEVPKSLAQSDGSQQPWVIRSDAACLQKILSQLLSNALKFTASGTITVRAQPREASTAGGMPMIEISVSDTGHGIAQDQLRRVFTPFTQLDSSISRKHGGTGLGLALCKRLAELMGGRVGVSSELGKGSTFWFTALAPWVTSPQAMPALPAAALESAPLAALDPSPLLSPLLPTRTLQKITVLVVDDNAINLKVACAMLLKFGYAILTASGGREAIDVVAQAIAKDEPIGAILMDVHMPDVDGLQATAAILKAHGAFAPPIIALTADVSGQARERCMRAGMVDYMTKPLVRTALESALGRWVKVAQSPLTSSGLADNLVASPSPPTSPSPSPWGLGNLEVSDIPVDDNLTVADRLTSVFGDQVMLQAQSPYEAPAPLNAQMFEPLGEADLAMPVVMVDFERLNEFKEFDDAELSMTRDVIALLFNEVPVQFSAIERAIANDDAGGLSRSAHALRGAASNVGAVTVQHLCSLLERETLEQKAVPPGAIACLEGLRLAWNRTRPLLENWH